MSKSTDVTATPPSSDNAMIVNCVAYRNDGTRLRDISIDGISEILKESDTFVWVGLHEPDSALLLKLQEEFDLHDLAVEDAQLAHQRTKIETYGDSLFIVVQTAQLTNGHIAFGETHVFLGKRYLITVRHGASLSYKPARQACEKSPDLLALGPSYGLYSVLDYIVDNLLPIVREFREELEELEKDIFADTFNRHTVRRLYDMQRDLMTLRLAAAPMQDVINQLVRMHPELIPDELRVYFRDVYDHVFRVNESISAMREMLTAAINVNLSLVTFGQNEVMKKLAGWAAMLAAPTLVTSWYGMNFTHMPELTKPWAYPVIMIVVAGLVGTIYLALKRAKWF
ncbi:MAG TPA: magnesium/cobalt transporter CorA [Dyella sp.]|nr:magnesium/cobalt transporter CorA [Dyella sp.]